MELRIKGNHKCPFLELIINLQVSVVSWVILGVGDIANSGANNTFALVGSTFVETF